MKKILLIVAIAVSVIAPTQFSMSQVSVEQKTLAERLGYARDARLLIVHADDLGMTHSVNAATLKAFETGLVNSGSIMVPCPWFTEIARHARSQPELDLGLHLTLTSEWALLRWGPVLSKDRAPSLFNKDGYLYPLETEAAASVDLREAEAEIRAQIDRAKAFGIQPTHLDSHMGTLYQNQNLFTMFLRVAREHKLPIRMWKGMFVEGGAFPSSILKPEDVVLDHVVSIGPNVTPEGWTKFYSDAVKNMPPGVTEFVVHLAYEDAEMRATAIDHPNWGAEWRQRDFNYFTSEAFRQVLREQNVKLITWRELGKLLTK